MNPVCRDTITVENKNGIHLVPSSQIARLAGTFDGEVRLSNGSRSADAKTIVEIVSLGAVQGTVLNVEAVGVGCDELIDQLKALFAAGFPTDS